MIDTKEDIEIYQRILFKPCDIDAQIEGLTLDQKKSLASHLAQKVAFEAVYKKSFKQDEISVPENYYHAPSFVSYICCCFFPEHYQSTFNITTSMFLSKIAKTFMFWRDDFLDLPVPTDEDRNKPAPKPDIYGPLWLIITYIIVLGLAANLNDYFAMGAKATNFHFHPQFLSKALALNVLFRLAQILIYPSVVGCLDGQLSNTECAHLVGYGILLYMVPTAVCTVPKKSLHMLMLGIAALTRGIFLARNFASRIPVRGSIIFFVIAGAQALHYFTVNGTFFNLPSVSFNSHKVATHAHFLLTREFHG